MKKISFIFLLLFVVIAAGCLKQDSSTNNGVNTNVPQGNFIGQFTLIHKNAKSGNLDTASATITLALSAASFNVGGDTTKIQAPSNGTFAIDDQLITFTDVTVTKRTPANTPKKHLNGPFLYTYSGSNLQIHGSSDTLSYNYNLSRF